MAYNTVPAHFLLAIQAIATEDATGFAIESKSKGVPDEVVLTMLRHWLRKAEDQYHAAFTNKG